MSSRHARPRHTSHPPASGRGHAANGHTAMGPSTPGAGQPHPRADPSVPAPPAHPATRSRRPALLQGHGQRATGGPCSRKPEGLWAGTGRVRGGLQGRTWHPGWVPVHLLLPSVLRASGKSLRVRSLGCHLTRGSPPTAPVTREKVGLNSPESHRADTLRAYEHLPWVSRGNR